MKKIVLSTVAITMLALTGANADSASDIAEMKAMMKQMNQRLAKLETENVQLRSQAKQAKKTSTKKKKTTAVAKTEVTNEETAAHVEKFAKASVVKSKAPLLKFSGKHYLGFVSSEDGEGVRDNRFETRRNYFQVKGYLGEDSKDFFRITLDTYQISDGKDDGIYIAGKDSEGTWNVRLKYAYLYLDEVLPFTGVEIGQAHRPWIDYEEHGGWNYRSISKVFVEAGNGAHLTNSADLGINFKTKTDYFSSELGLFNGEGYHGIEDGEGLSAEWRLTGHIFGEGTHKRKKSSTYADVSFLGQWNADSNKHGNEDLNWYGFHAVYNQPEFLLAAQYIATEDAASKYAGEGYSINGELRLGEIAEELNYVGIIGRYDYFDMDDNSGDKKRTIAGITYKYNKHVEFIANYLGEKGSALDPDEEQDAFMLTTEVNW
jgi:hypothetical protein